MVGRSTQWPSFLLLFWRFHADLLIFVQVIAVRPFILLLLLSLRFFPVLLFLLLNAQHKMIQPINRIHKVFLLPHFLSLLGVN